MNFPHEQMDAVSNVARTGRTSSDGIVSLYFKMSKRRVFPKGIATLSERMGGSCRPDERRRGVSQIAAQLS